MRRIAVIAVHGVGDQKPFETSQTIAEMLVRDRPGEFQPFVREEMQISVPPLQKRGDAGALAGIEGGLKKPLRGFDPQSPLVAEKLRKMREQNGAAGKVSAAPQAGFMATVRKSDFRHGIKHLDAASRNACEEMDEQLEEYSPESDDRVYQTVRHRSFLTNGSAEPTCETHVYEMYWGDLARVGPGILQGFTELYHLLFDVCMLGRRTADSVMQLYPQSNLWRLLSFAHRTAESLLTRFIFPFNLLALAVTCVLGLALLPANWADMASRVSPPVIVVGGVIYLFWKLCWSRLKGGGAPRMWLFVPLIFLIGGGATWIGMNMPGFKPETHLSAGGFCVMLAAFTAFAYLIIKYKERRPAAHYVALMGMAVAGVLQTYWLFFAQRGDDSHVVVEAALHTLEIILIVSTFVWLAIWANALLVLTLPLLPQMHADDDPMTRERLRRSSWTVVIATMLPLSATVVFNASIWAAVLYLFNQLNSDALKGVTHYPVRFFITSVLPEHLPVNAAFVELGRLTASNLPAALLVLGLAGVASIWALFPAAVREIGEPEPADTDRQSAMALGESLCWFFKIMRWVGEVFRAGVIAVALGAGGSMVLGAIWPGLPFRIAHHVAPGLTTFFQANRNDFIDYSMLAGGLLLLGLLLGHGPLKALSAGFHAVLDVAVDVVVWLRMHPQQSNTRARICTRFAALFRHIGEWKAPDGEGYDRIVIISHSQGTIISAELLWYLNASTRWQNPVKQPIDLFTMGCPLRQLYQQRFPFLYLWAQCDGNAAGQSFPALSNVQSWTNAYGAGDYVGRYLWYPSDVVDKQLRHPKCCPSKMWDIDELHAAGTDGAHWEFCAGYTAHTKYWHGYSPSISHTLAALIRRACAAPSEVRGSPSTARPTSESAGRFVE